MDAIANVLNNWWQKPFDPNGDAVNWALFLGFVVVVVFMWTRVLRQIATE